MLNEGVHNSSTGSIYKILSLVCDVITDFQRKESSKRYMERKRRERAEEGKA